MISRSISRLFSSRPFRVLGVQQVAIGNLTKDPLSKFWGDILGAKKLKTFESKKENVNEDVMQFGKGLGVVEIDLMAPLDANKSPKVHVPALNHIGLWIDDLPACVKYLESKGVKVLGGIRPGASGFDITFVHPKSACGILLELVQAPKSVIAKYDEHKD